MIVEPTNLQGYIVVGVLVVAILAVAYIEYKR